MNYPPELHELVRNADSFEKNHEWTKAIECYEKVLEYDMAAIDEAKMLANIMQIHEKQGAKDLAIEYGEKAYEIVQTHMLYRTNEGAHLRGFIRGTVNRLRGGSFFGGFWTWLTGK